MAPRRPAPAPRRLAAKQEDPPGQAGPGGGLLPGLRHPRSSRPTCPGSTPRWTARPTATPTPRAAPPAARWSQRRAVPVQPPRHRPGGGQLLNAWDLARLHLYGDQDDRGQARHADAPSAQLSGHAPARPWPTPPWPAGQPETLRRGGQEGFRGGGDGTGRGPPAHQLDEAAGSRWAGQLQAHGAQRYHHARVRSPSCWAHPAGRFCRQTDGPVSLPWAHRQERADLVPWTDTDDAGLRDYTERLLKFRGKDVVEDALALVASQHAYHPVRGIWRAWSGMGGPAWTPC